MGDGDVTSKQRDIRRVRRNPRTVCTWMDLVESHSRKIKGRGTSQAIAQPLPDMPGSALTSTGSGTSQSVHLFAQCPAQNRCPIQLAALNLYQTLPDPSLNNVFAGMVTAS